MNWQGMDSGHRGGIQGAVPVLPDGRLRKVTARISGMYDRTVGFDSWERRRLSVLRRVGWLWPPSVLHLGNGGYFPGVKVVGAPHVESKSRTGTVHPLRRKS